MKAQIIKKKKKITVIPSRHGDEQFVFPHFDADRQVVFRHEFASFESVVFVFVTGKRVVQRRPLVQFGEFLYRRGRSYQTRYHWKKKNKIKNASFY